MKTVCRLVFFNLVALIFISCSHTPRNGSVYINKFDIDNFKTDDPVTIKADVVQYARDALYKELQRSLIDESRMRLATSCNNAEYKLTGEFFSINTEEQRKFGGITRRKYEVEVEGRLLRCDNNQIVADFSKAKKSDSLTELIESLANSIIREIRYVEAQAEIPKY